MRISDWSSDVCSSDLTERASAARATLKPVRAELVEAPLFLCDAERKERPPSTALQALRNKLRANGSGGNMDIFDPCRKSEEHTSELQSLMRISYAVFCLKKKNTQNQ